MKHPPIVVTIERIIQDGRTVHLDALESYHLAYREFVAYFAQRDVITPHDLVIGAHFAYGWMPTIIELKHNGDPLADIARCAELLTQAHCGATLSLVELATLKALINHSMIGTSKLLHFVSPSAYAIWDSRVYRYLFGKAPQEYHIQDPALYWDYVRCCRCLVEDPRFAAVHDAMSLGVGYPISRLRALELVMYLSG